MKKVFPLLSTTTGLPLTGRQITLVRMLPDDGAEVACSELTATGTYLATAINPGLYKVFDRTGGTMPGTDLDQVIDVAAATLMELDLGNATSGFLAAPDNTFRAIEKSDVVDLETDITTLGTQISNAAAAVIAEVNARIQSEATIRTDVIASVSDLTSDLASSVSSQTNALSKNKIDNIELYCRIMYAAGLIDFVNGTMYKSWNSSGGSGMIFVSVAALIVPLDVIQEGIKAKFESPIASDVAPSGAYWETPIALGTGTHLHGQMPSLGITEKVKSIYFLLDETSTGSARVFRAALRVMQPSDFDASIGILPQQ